MSNIAASAIKRSAATTDRNAVYREAANELRTLRTTIEQSTGKWSLTKEKSAHTIKHKLK
jgi:hypothetical protein